MSGFLSREAEAVLSAQEAEARHNFYRATAHDSRLAERASGSPYQQQWTTALHPAMTSAQLQTSPHVFSTPAQYVSGPSLNPNAFARGQYAPSAPHVVPSSPYSSEQHWPNIPWPTLHPEEVEVSSDSRSASPNPADLHNFGFPLPDGRSWRCAYPSCTSQAAFTRGCDLRKHYRRHTKSLFCRHEDCPQSREGGFSSRKDRDRHESKVLPVHSCCMIYLADQLHQAQARCSVHAQRMRKDLQPSRQHERSCTKDSSKAFLTVHSYHLLLYQAVQRGED